MKRYLTILCVAALLLAGCASRPQLLSKSTANPASVDLSGNWALRQVDGEGLLRGGDAEQKIQMPKRTSQRRPQRTRRSSGGIAVNVFLETGNALRITQTVDGMFISFDRAIVEEYTFGENRLVAVGPIEAQRVSGWENGAFVVETLDRDGVRLSESWSLAEQGAVLVRRIAMIKGDKRELDVEQVFDRS